jgi:hypothetical protein
MAWFWSDDLARLLIERDGISPERVSAWLSGPVAHRSDGEALELARTLLGAASEDHADATQTSAA